MTRYTRAKGSKASNERLPKDATPWHTMKQQLQNRQETSETVTKNKSAKELLKEKEQSLGHDTANANNIWAKFEDSKPKVKQQDKNNKLKTTNVNKVIKQNGTEKQLKNDVGKTTSNALPKQLKRKLNERDGNEITNENKKSNKQNSGSAIQNIGTKNKNNILRKTNQGNKKDTIKSNKNDSVNTNTNAQTDNLGPKDGENSKFEGILSKRQKRNIKKKENNADTPGRFVRLQNHSNLNQGKKQNHLKPGKARDDKQHNRRKPDLPMKVMINGKEIELVRYDGFPIKKEDAERLKDLKQKMIMKGIPKSEINVAMKLERRKAEKALTRDKKTVCFNCRVTGHNLSECPELDNKDNGTGICFKCGSTEHTHFECKVGKADEYRYATCFICREQGHISKQCPDNPKGIYPQGGACKLCGDVTHLKKDCPDLIQQNEETAITLGTINSAALESLDGGTAMNAKTIPKKSPKKKVISF